MGNKAFFTDLDGTLLNDQKQVSPGNRAAINALRKAGHHIVITTGRPLVSAIKQAQALDLVGEKSILIAFNGGVLYDLEKQTVIERTELPLSYVFDLFDEANRRELQVQTYTETKVVAEPRCENDILSLYCKRINMAYEIYPNIRMLTRNPEKVLLIDLESRKRLDQFIEEVSPSFRDILDFRYSSKEYLEIVLNGVNKGSAILRVAEYLGIDPENTVAAGDAENDIPMLAAAHYGIAMKNSFPEVLAQIPLVTENDNNHDGVAEIIEKYLL